jgi:hypothetical protein
MTINYGRNKLMIARHEAGHAVIARVLNVNIVYATLAGVAGSSPQVLTKSASHQRPNDLDALEHNAMVVLAGPLAQQQHRPKSPREQERAWEDGGDWYDDKLNAINLLLMLLMRRRGEPVVLGSGQLEGERAQELGDLFDRTISKTASLVDQHWPAICRVAKALMSDRVLSEAEIDALIEGKAK